MPPPPGPSDDVIVGPFFQTAGIRLQRGRYFSDADRAGSLPVAMINDKMAKLYWPDEDPIGKQFRFSARPSSPWLTIVGVTGDMRRQGLERDPIPQVFRTDAQDSEATEAVVRASRQELAARRVWTSMRSKAGTRPFVKMMIQPAVKPSPSCGASKKNRSELRQRHPRLLK